MQSHALSHPFFHFQSFAVSIAISCGDPGVPPNAVVLGTRSWTYGSVLQYSCLPGGLLVGNSTRHCQEDGSWSGVPPYCTGKAIKRIMCFLLKKNMREKIFNNRETKEVSVSEKQRASPHVTLHSKSFHAGKSA